MSGALDFASLLAALVSIATLAGVAVQWGSQRQKLSDFERRVTVCEERLNAHSQKVDDLKTLSTRTESELQAIKAALDRLLERLDSRS